MLSQIRTELSRWTLRAALAGLALGIGASSASAAAPAEAIAPSSDRAWVITQPAQLQDLYLDGQLTDTRGNRWDVGILPGVRTTGREAATEWRQAGHSFGNAGDALGRYGEAAFWGDLADTSVDGLRFAFDDCLKQTIFVGIPEGLGETNADLAEAVREKPFAWLPITAARVLTGYVIEPPVRLVAGSVGAVGGGIWSVAAPVVGSTFPVFAATGHATKGVAVDALIEGTVVPTLALGWHHLAYPLAIANPEPAEHHDGHFGLHITEGP